MTGEAVLAPFPVETAIARRELEYQRWLRRSRLVHLARRALPATIIAIVVLIAGALVVRSIIRHMGEAAGGSNLSIHMSNAQFYGRDKSGRPFILSAAEADRDDRDFALIVLAGPSLVFDAGGAKATRVSADHGIYRQDTRIGRFNGRVTVRDGQGDTFVTDQAVVDGAHGTVNGPVAVKGEGAIGSITAQSFQILDNGQRVILRGDVHSIIKRD